MITESILNGRGISLRQIELEDCTDSYVKWLNDPEVNKYLETKWNDQTLESVERFVREQRENNHSYLFAIVENGNNRHIGNIKIGPINEYHHHAEISYFIGDKKYWNRGLASEAIHLICGFGFYVLNLHRVEAGVYAMAVGSWRALEKNGFVREAVFRKKAFFQNEYIDTYHYGLLESEFGQI